jgi:hypothetical protein
MNPNHKTTFAALALLSIAHAHAGDVVTLTWKKDAPANAQTAVLTLAAGESAKVKWTATSTASEPTNLSGFVAARMSVTIGEVTKVAALFTGASQPATIPLEVAGPATLALSASLGPEDYAIATLEVTRPASPSVTPSNAAVIPVDANGTFTVILESSTDLITWTAANPGDYSGNTVKRFFRTRIVKK